MGPLKLLYRRMNSVSISGKTGVLLFAVIAVLLTAGFPKMGNIIQGQEIKSEKKIETPESVNKENESALHVLTN